MTNRFLRFTFLLTSVIALPAASNCPSSFGDSEQPVRFSDSFKPGKPPYEITIRDGVAWGVSISGSDFLRYGTAIFAEMPTIKHIRFKEGASLHRRGETFSQVFNNPLLSEIVSLDLEGGRIGVGGATALATSPYLRNLQVLNLAGNDIGAYGVQLLAKSPNLSHLKTLNLQVNGIANLDIASLNGATFAQSLESLELGFNPLGTQVELIGDMSFPRLTDLNLAGTNITSQTLKILGTSKIWAQLESLDVSGNKIGNAGFEVLVESPGLNNLRKLDASDCGLTTRSIAMLAGSASINNLEVLDLSLNRLKDSGISKLVSLDKVRSLTELSLGGTVITSKGVKAIADSTNLRNLKTLKINNNEIGDSGVEALASSTELTNLRRLALMDNGISASGVAILIKAAYLENLTALLLSENPDIGDEGVRILAESRLRSLEDLGLGRTRISNKAVEYIANSENFRHLRRLNIADNYRVSARGVKIIFDSPILDSLSKLDIFSFVQALGNEEKKWIDRLRSAKHVAVTLNKGRVEDLRPSND